MLIKTPFTAILDKLDLFFEKGKHDITQPTGDFFYDPWKLKNEYLNTPLEDVWSSLPIDTGQARIIVLESPSCYTQHADIDDRYHLNLSGDEGYLIDLETKEMFKLERDGVWYEMDAGKIHTAISIGEHLRVQLVIRKLLTRNSLNNPLRVGIEPSGNNSRYHFDNKISPWLNRANKKGIINNFSLKDNNVYFDIEKDSFSELTSVVPQEFKLWT